jgi:hypothetical protein
LNFFLPDAQNGFEFVGLFGIALCIFTESNFWWTQINAEIVGQMSARLQAVTPLSPSELATDPDQPFNYCCKIPIARNIKGAHFAVGCDCWDHHLPKRSAVMNQEKYIGMDVHQATISVAGMDSSGKLIMECILETKAATILEFIAGLRGTLSVTFEEGTSAAWLHDLLKPHVSHFVVCDPRRNAPLKAARGIGSMRGNRPSYYTATSSMLCTTESTGFAP